MNLDVAVDQGPDTIEIHVCSPTYLLHPQMQLSDVERWDTDRNTSGQNNDISCTRASQSSSIIKRRYKLKVPSSRHQDE